MKEKQERTNKTKKDIMEAFWNIYCEKRIEKITVKEVTKKAGYNRSTFYEYFIDIYDVLEQIEKEVIPTKEELPPLSMANVELGMPVDIFMKLYDKNSDYYFVLLGDKGDPAFAGKLKNSIKEMLMETLVSTTKVNTLELDFILEFILSAMIGVMSYWFKQDKVLPAEELLKLISGFMESGIMSKFNNYNLGA